MRLLLPLAWLGRQGTRALAALVVLGIALPAVGALLKPWLSAAVFALLCSSFMRLDTARLRACLQRPGLLVAGTVWSAIVLPLVFVAVGQLLGLRQAVPEWFLGLMLQGVASPMMAAPAMAALMGLDATLVLVSMIACTLILPLSAPLFAEAFIGGGLEFSPWAMAVRLAALIAGGALVGRLLRRIVGVERIERRRAEIDGVNILVLYVFVAAIMQNVAGYLLRDPWLALGYTALAFGVFGAILLLSVVVFLPAGRANALALGFMAAQRNLGLMLAAVGNVLPEATWLYFALSQFPIYLSPQLLAPLLRERKGD